MLHSLLITNYRAAADLIAGIVRASGQITLEQIHCPAPTPSQLSRALNTLTLDAIFVDTTDPDQAEMLCDEIKKRAGNTAIIGFSAEQATKHNPITPYTLSWPFSSADLQRTVRRAIREISGKTLRNLYSVLPAKGGAGATTVTLNVACHLASSFGKSVLVAEADLRSGTMTDRLSAKPAQSMIQTLSCADDCMSLIWPRHVARKFGVDWMLTDRDKTSLQPLWCDYRHLLTFAAARYDYALVDLPELLDQNASEIAVLSKRVFVVTTPEVLSLRLARQRIEELESFGVLKSRIQVLVNRLRYCDLHPRDITASLGCEVGGIFPNDYHAVEGSILNSTFVDRRTKLGKAYLSLAGSIAGASKPALSLGTGQSMFRFLTSIKRSAVRV